MDIITEEWKPIILDGELIPFDISNFGRVRSNRIDYITNGTGKYYRYVNLPYQGSRRNFLVHRLVAEAFIPNPENKSQVNHIDGVKWNNFVYNLEWATPQENIDHAIANGLILVGEKSPASKLTDAQVHEICKMLATGMKRKKVAHKMGIPESAVTDIYYGNTWKHISCQYTIKQFRSTSVEIKELIGKGITKPEDIMRQLGWPDTKKSRQRISTAKYELAHVVYVKKRQPKVLCSTIIPLAEVGSEVEEVMTYASDKAQQ